MGCHTWFFRPIRDGEQPDDTCAYSQEKYGDDRYTGHGTPSDLFRVGDYPEVFLLSLKETLEFIELRRDKMSFPVENWEEKLADFWAKNPDGVIEFG